MGTPGSRRSWEHREHIRRGPPFLLSSYLAPCPPPLSASLARTCSTQKRKIKIEGRTVLCYLGWEGDVGVEWDGSKKAWAAEHGPATKAFKTSLLQLCPFLAGTFHVLCCPLIVGITRFGTAPCWRDDLCCGAFPVAEMYQGVGSFPLLGQALVTGTSPVF